MPGESRLLAAALRSFAAPLVWFLYFALVYGTEWVLCTRASDSAHASLTIAAALFALLAMVLLIRANWAPSFGRDRQATERFLGRTGIALGALSLVALVWVTMPVLWLQPCMLPA